MRYKISELSTLLNVTTNTIRRYEKMGYITSKRSENSNYRYFTEDDITIFMNVRLLRKYGFTHTEIADMKNKQLTDLITAYEKRMEIIDGQLYFLTNLRHRLKDDLLLMKKADANKEQCYIRDCVPLSYVLYQRGEKILTEPNRVITIQDYLYLSPEVQRIYLIRKEDVENDNIVLNAGWAIKMKDVEKYKINENEYTERYEKRKSLLSVVKLPLQSGNNSKWMDAKESLLEKPFQYMQEHNLKVDGDIIGIVIANVLEENQEMQYILVGIPITEL
jgi:DNA-binding transcriptional MerR regulator